MSDSIPMNVWQSRPIPVSPAKWHKRLQRNVKAQISYEALCRLGGVAPRVSGPDLDRCVYILRGSEHAYPVGHPDALGVAYPNYSATRTDALRIMEILAYGFFDYAAREAVRGRELFRVVYPRGRMKSGKARSTAERMRRMRKGRG